ncbi:MAG: phosphoenolpyruvate--protein phosphotransferase [Kiritimatiellae bacterium]|nr:phosphoenolpyruvate--protein phosphotransferase [Kiritimatiellia bacterium]
MTTTRHEPHETPSAKILTGIAASRGYASGSAVIFRTEQELQISDFSLSPDDVPAELERLENALALTRTQLQSLSQELEQRISGNEAAVLTGQIMMTSDPEFLSPCRKLICDELQNAKSAVWHTAQHFTRAFAAMNDPYLRERGKDIEDFARRLIRNLSGGGEDRIARFNQPCIVVADDVSPGETIAMPKDKILGLVTEKGSLTSHSTLLARALGIPAVVGVPNCLNEINPGDEVLLDGVSGKVIHNPGDSERKAFAKVVSHAKSFQSFVEEGRQFPGATSDGHSVPFLANVSADCRMTDLPKVAAEGIGLYRTEYLWISLNREPTEQEQEEAYTAAVRSLPQGSVTTIRILDLGGDKLLRSEGVTEPNPFLGNRSIRYLLKNPDVLRRQFRSILRASSHGKVNVLYPMIATIEELRAVNLELHRCMTELREKGIPFDNQIKRGAMIEIPAAALIAGTLAKEVDFFSIGTNDLIQYTLAVDRSNSAVSRLYQPTHPAVLQLIHLTVQAAKARGIPVSVCGEAAADPIFAALLIGLGVDALSMAPNLIPLVKRVIRQLPYAELQELANEALARQSDSAAAIANVCRNRLINLVPELLYLR